MEFMFCLLNGRIISVKIGLFFQEITSITDVPGSNFLLPPFLTGGKWDFQEENLLLAMVNFKPELPLSIPNIIILWNEVIYWALQNTGLMKKMSSYQGQFADSYL